MTSHTQYCTLYRLGYWCSLDAECRSEPNEALDPLLSHKVTFALINKIGDSSYMGHSIITGYADRPGVFDEDGETFPDIETAVRAHAARLMKVTEMPGRWTDRQPRHDTWQGTVATAFDPAVAAD